MSDKSIRQEAQYAAKSKKSELDTVKIAVIGKGGAGKSSLINAIVDDYVCETGVDTDTTLEKSIDIHFGSLVFTDLPGYGTKGFPKEQWETQFQPEQYDLLLHVVNSKLTKDDTEFCEKVASGDLPVVVVRTFDDLLKSDKSRKRAEIRQDLVKAYGRNMPIAFVGQGEDEDDYYGVDACNEQIESKLSSAKKYAFNRWAKAYTLEQLEKKAEAAYQMVHEKAAMSAVANAIPIAGIPMDAKIQYDLSQEILGIFGIRQEKYDDILTKHGQVIKPLLDEVNSFGTKEGLVILAKQMLGKKAATELLNKVPLLGTIVAAGIGFGLTELMGHYIVKQASELSEIILKEELENH
jgi:GTP-binding protein EngB required for normal cell division